MAYEVVPAVQAVLDVFPEKKKDGFDRVMDVAHIFLIHSFHNMVLPQL